jgi:putative holliday junction resolvase
LSRCLGLDWGTKRIGVAISDDRGVLAVGYAIWPAHDWLTKLERAVADESIAYLVIGYPLTLRGEVGPKAKEVDRMIAQLEKLGYDVRRWDERYTTQDAGSALSRIGISERKQRGKVDMAAAVLLLQSYLDETRVKKENEGGG